MNRDDIIRMALEAGFAEWYGTDSPEFLSLIERFANLVAAHEREACAQICLDQKWHGDWSDCCDAIRARGEQ